MVLPDLAECGAHSSGLESPPGGQPHLVVSILVMLPTPD